MIEDRVDWLVNRHHVACLALLRLKKPAAYGRAPAFLTLLRGFLHHGGQLMEFIRERESGQNRSESSEIRKTDGRVFANLEATSPLPPK